MVGRFWRLEVASERIAEFERFAGGSALPLVRGKMGCAAVFVLREADSLRYALIAFWVSRKAMAVALSTPEWREILRTLEGFGLQADEREGLVYEGISFFLAGEKPEAPSAAPGV